MSTTLRIVLLIGIVLYFAVLVGLLRVRRLQLKYTLLWMLMGIFFLLMVIFPGILEGIRDLLGFQDNMNTLFVIMIGFLILLIMSVTSIVSGQSEKIKELAQENALLEKRIRELEGDKTENRPLS
ncbi:MAG: DUF2304 domain-containing protein [Lachnospiraceae bacterium]|nr:DUF2304 domain-containing protein [Lachnospiraceae bacterium]